MQSTQDLLRQAIAAAREGREWTARDMFLRVVELEPRNEIAWMWLAGLLDGLDDRIRACEQVLSINPRNLNAKQYLSQLLAEKQKKQDEENLRAEKMLTWVKNAVQAGRKESALLELRNLTSNPNFKNPEMWRLFADLSPELDERVRALEQLAELKPDDVHVQEELQQARYYLENPIHQAELYEEHGHIEQALVAYRRIATKTAARSQEWERIFRKITELENLKQDQIAYIAPALDIARLTAGPPLVYFMFTLVHVGINPFAHPDPAWVGLVWVAFGGFLVALASVRSHNRLWTLLFKDTGAKDSPMARRATAATGWLLVLLPYMVLFIVAWNRFVLSLENIVNMQLTP
jgi:tetratricopeptide (TPR) repeat protein